MPCTIIAGGQWGDEGKGKIAAYLALTNKPKIIARAGVGPNAGHTVIWKGEKLGLREISCGFVHEGARVLIGPGVLVNPEVVLDEIEKTGIGDRIGIDRKCAIIEQEHIEQDRSSKHLKGEIGTTGTGCGPANAERVNRSSKLAEEIEELKEFLTDVPQEVNDALKDGEEVFIEGSQGFGLSLIHGTFPYVTSKDISASTLAADVGVGPTNVDEVLLIFKAYISRVGAGPFPTEMPLEKAEEMGIVEHGTVTGRRRRIGEFDFDLAKRSAMINGATQLAITNVDRLFDGNQKIKEYGKLTKEAREFIEKIESEVNVPVTLVSTGPGTEDIVDLRSEKL